MDLFQPLVLTALIGLMAFLYASVGHGGASGYLAVLALFATAPSLMKQSALLLNLSVSLIAFYQYQKQGHFRWALFWPFALGSIPMAYFGAQWVISDAMYKKLLGLCLAIAVLRMLYQPSTQIQTRLPIWAGILTGALIGCISGMIGIGGGILLTPCLLLMAWANLKEAAALSALFIFVNSLAGLFGMNQWGNMLQGPLPYWVLVASIMGLFGASWGARRASKLSLKITLAMVLLIASVKLLFT